MPYDSTSYAPQVETTHRTIGPVEQTLIEARELLPNAEFWAQPRQYGRTLQDYCGAAGHERAGCVQVQIFRAAGRWFIGAIRLFERANGIPDTPEWNNADERVWADVHPAFDRAIALAASEGA